MRSWYATFRSLLLPLLVAGIVSLVFLAQPPKVAAACPSVCQAESCSWQSVYSCTPIWCQTCQQCPYSCCSCGENRLCNNYPEECPWETCYQDCNCTQYKCGQDCGYSWQYVCTCVPAHEGQSCGPGLTCQSGGCQPAPPTPTPTPSAPGGNYYCSDALTCPNGRTYRVVCDLPCGLGGNCQNDPIDACNTAPIQCTTANDCPEAQPIVGNCQQEVGAQCTKWDQCGCANNCTRGCVSNQCVYNSSQCTGPGGGGPTSTPTPTPPPGCVWGAWSSCSGSPATKTRSDNCGNNETANCTGNIQARAVAVSPGDTSCTAVRASTSGIAGSVHQFTVGSASQPAAQTQSGASYVTFSSLVGGSYTLSPTVSGNYNLARACWSQVLNAPGSGEGLTTNLSVPLDGDTLTWDVGYTPVGPWVQTQGGNVYAAGNVTSYIPSGVSPRVLNLTGQ